MTSRFDNRWIGAHDRPIALLARHSRPWRIRRAAPFACTVLARNPKGEKYLVGARMSCVDLSLFQLVEGLRYAFPKAAKTALTKAPRVQALLDRAAEQARLSAYLVSERWMAFNEDGIFRR